MTLNWFKGFKALISGDVNKKDIDSRTLDKNTKGAVILKISNKSSLAGLLNVNDIIIEVQKTPIKKSITTGLRYSNNTTTPKCYTNSPLTTVRSPVRGATAPVSRNDGPTTWGVRGDQHSEARSTASEATNTRRPGHKPTKHQTTEPNNRTNRYTLLTRGGASAHTPISHDSRSLKPLPSVHKLYKR